MNIVATIKLPDGQETRVIREIDNTVTISHESSTPNILHVRPEEGASVSVSQSGQNLVTVGSGVYQTIGEGNVWGSINGNITNQTDLVEYISTAIDAIPTPATPTLQSVTDEGNTTTNNIGIGATSSLFYPLTIEPNGTNNYIELRGSTVNAGMYAVGKGLLAFDTSKNFIVYTGGINEKMRVTSAGNVGIGTTAPSEKLEVAGNVKVSNGSDNISIIPNNSNGSISTTSQAVNGAIVSAVSDGLTFSSRDIYGGVNIGSFNNAGTVTLGAFGYGNVNYQTAHNSFAHTWYGSRASDPWMTLNNTGLGIGTTAPDKILTLCADGLQDGLNIKTVDGLNVGSLINANSNSTPVGSLFLNYGSTNTVLISAQSNRMGLRGGWTTGGQISFSSWTNEIMRVTSTGLGIGTAAPNYKLDVFGYDENDAINSNVAFNISRVVKPDLTNTTATLQAGTELPLANMYYSITYYNAIGETERGGFVTILPTSGNQRVLLENLPISPDPSVIGRKIYRNKSTDGSSYGALIATISDNTTTSYLDSLPESDPIFSGHIFSRTIWNTANTTTNFISVDNVRSMVVDPNRTVFGFNAGQDLTRGGSTTLIGSNAGANITYASGNTIIGHNSGANITTGPQNVLIGDSAGSSGLTTGGYNIALGPNTLKTNGEHNIAMGYYTGQSLNSGNRNVLIGSYIAQGTSVTFNESVIIGVSASATTGVNGQVNINNLIFGNKLTQVVGIGTSNPLATLHVNSDNNNTSMSTLISNENAGGRAGVTFNLPNVLNELYSVGIDNDRYFKISNGASLSSNTRIVIAPTGNVGIGTSIPSTPLEVYRSNGNDISILTLRGYSPLYGKFLEIYNPQGDNNTDTNLIFDISQSNGSRGGVKMTSYGNVVNGSIPFNFVANSGAGGPGFVFSITNTRTGWGHTAFRNGAGIDNFTINSSGDIYARGNVGIGTTTPTEKLEVAGNVKISEGSQFKSIATQNDVNATQWEQSLEFFLPYRSDGTTPAENKSALKLGGVKFFEPRTTNGSRLHISNSLNLVSTSGNTGGGLSAVLGDINDTYPATSWRTSWSMFGNTTGRKGYVDGYFGVDFYSRQTQGNFTFGSPNGEFMRIASSGNVGIGTTAPSSKVHINGTAMEQLRMETQGGPASAADANGNIGDMAYDADFFYIKTSNGWGRVPLDFAF